MDFFASKHSLGDIETLLNPEQLAAVNHKDGPLLVLAGAGSGKTRVITYRIAKMVEDYGISPHQILAVTFTNKAAGEMRERIQEVLPPSASGRLSMGTFHSISARILREKGEVLGLDHTFTIFDQSDQKVLLERVMRDADIDPKTVNARSVLSIIESYKHRLLLPQDLQAGDGGGFGSPAYFAHKLYADYQQALRSQNAVDFSDLIMLAVHLLQNHKEVSDYYNQRWTYVLVDEFQDTNRAQFELIKQLTQKQQNICVVGDDDQSIYSWRGVEVRNILDFEKHYPGAVQVNLERNYRSSQQILDCANSIIKEIRGRHPKKLWTEKSSGYKPSVKRNLDAYEEARYVAGEIQELRRSLAVPLSQFAVFYRTNFQSRVFEDVFRERHIPHQVVGGTRFYDRKEIKDMTSYLRLITSPSDDVAFTRIINTPPRGIGVESQRKLMAYSQQHNLSLLDAIGHALDAGAFPTGVSRRLKDFWDMYQTLRQEYEEGADPSALTRAVFRRSGYEEALERQGSVEDESRRENINELIGVMEEKEAEGQTMAEIIESLALRADVDEYQDEDKVTLMTVHAAKGLEFDVVFLTGMEDGIFPHQMSMYDPEQITEERRLAYVGMTRARERLFLTWAQDRPHSSSNGASRFLEDIPPQFLEREKKKNTIPKWNIYVRESQRKRRSFDEDDTPIRHGHDSLEGLEKYRKAMPGRPESGVTTHMPKMVTPEMVRSGVDIPLQRQSKPKPEDEQPKAAVDTAGVSGEDLSKGDMVFHSQYGIGKVASVRGVGQQAIVQVLFPGRPAKKFKAQFLKKVKGGG